MEYYTSNIKKNLIRPVNEPNSIYDVSVHRRGAITQLIIKKIEPFMTTMVKEKEVEIGLEFGHQVTESNVFWSNELLFTLIEMIS